MEKVVVLIGCEDQRGLIHKITGVLLHHGFNVTETQEYVDSAKQRFFMRIQFEGTPDCKKLESELRLVLPPASTCQVRILLPRKVVIFTSDEPHCLGDLLLRWTNKELPAQILGIVSQLETCREITERFDLPFHCVPVNKLSREEHEVEILKVVEPYKPDYVILARYMRILTKKFIEKFNQRILNIHHSFLPAFIGRNPYEQAYERGVKIIGATAHFVTEDLDQGPIVTQSVIQVNHADNPAEMARRGQDVERIVLAHATELILEDRVLIDGGRTIVFE